MSVTSHRLTPQGKNQSLSGRAPPGMSQTTHGWEHAFIALACLFCGIILAVDVFWEAYDAAVNPASIIHTWHIAIEFLATALLAFAAKLAFTQLASLRLKAVHSDEKLQRLRHEFDTVLHDRFALWNLSKSEIDVALLTIRGLSICRIAEMRHTQQGTIKAQLSAIFKKAGVSSRTELLAMFIDELLDFGSLPKEKRPPEGGLLHSSVH